MAKLLKIVARLLGGTLEWVLILLILFSFAIRTSPVQTYLAGIATDYLSEELNTTVKIDAVDIVFVDRVDLKGVLVLDLQQDTLASIGSLLVNVSGISQFSGRRIHVDDLTLDQGVVNIKRDKKGDYNYWFIQDYFASDSPKTGAKSPVFTLDNIYISALRFSYDDFRKGYSEDGMDFNHLAFSDVNLELENLKIKDEVISGEIHHFSARDRSGFQLEKFSAKSVVSPQGIFLTDLGIKTPASNIKSKKFRLLYTGYTDFQSFEDSVAFRSDLYESVISLKDVAYFAPVLTGMDQELTFSGKVSKYVKNLRIADFELSTGEKTHLAGTINLPDFRAIKSAFYQERLEYAYIDIEDIQSIKMPKGSGSRFISLDPELQRLRYFEAEDVRIDGIYAQFVVSSDEVSTALGSVNIDNGIWFTQNPANNSFYFGRSEASAYDVKVNEFQLGTFLNSDLYGVVDGTFFLSGEAFSLTDIRFTNIEGQVARFDLADYSYSDITIYETTFIDKVLTAKMDVADRNLEMHYDGVIDLNGEPKLDLSIDLKKALLNKLRFTETEGTDLVAKVKLDVVGLDPNKMVGNVTVHSLLYKEGKQEIKIPDLSMDVFRGERFDEFVVSSSILNASIKGKVNFNTIQYTFQDQLSQIFPGFNQLKLKEKQVPKTSEDHFTYTLITGDISKILDIFMPDLEVSPGTSMTGSYNGATRNFDMKLTADGIRYEGRTATGISIDQRAENTIIFADYSFQTLALNDSIRLEDVRFKANGNGDDLYSELTWNPGTSNETNIHWRTSFESLYKMNFNLEPSYFSINDNRWDISNEAVIKLDSLDLEVRDFKLIKDKQFIAIDGHVSRDDKEKLNFELNDIDLEELGQLVGMSTLLSGKLNGWGYITNPYNNLSYMGDLNIEQLAVNNETVGDVFVLSHWDKTVNTIELEGDLVYKGIQTFDFSGHYYAEREKDNLDFSLDFDETNIAFANAFMDPQVINDIRGFVNGSLKVTGTPNRPIVEGEVRLDDASAEIAMLGTIFRMNGIIQADSDGFYIDNMPVTDAEGNSGSLVGSIYHTDYADWNFDVAINLEDDAFKKDVVYAWKPAPLSKFLVLNTSYKEGDIYYGRAYATGTVEIFGYADNLEIMVDIKTEKGTKINFPMYGSSEMTDENDFIVFESTDSAVVEVEKKIDFTGVELDLNFHVTPDAQLKIIFNEQLGDEIVATGSGNIGIRMDNLGDLAMDGTYVVKDGVYNFAMGPVKQPFYIAEGGSITWTGNPYEANLDLSTYYKVKASLGELSPDQLSGGHEEVHCYLNLTESLLKPAIGFDIKVPKADESGKALVNRITSDKDELNRQFFSLLLWKKFQPMKGTSRAGGNAALDLVSNQINSMLSQVSEGYKLNVDLNSDAFGDNEVALGVSKGFLDDRLIVTGSFGVENHTSGEQSKSSLIGDLEVEYKLNEPGTFRVNVFNESNDNTVLQSNNQGQFKQGAGIHYQEDFNTLDDFRALQTFFDMFRKKENKRYPIRRKKKQTPIPTGDAKLED